MAAVGRDEPLTPWEEQRLADYLVGTHRAPSWG